jgi:site-specific recombinase XerD
MAGIEKNLSTHIARHSFAANSLQQSGNVYAVSSALGHASVKQTETYLNVGQAMVDKLLYKCLIREKKRI